MADEPQVAFAAFAQTLRPRRITVPPARGATGRAAVPQVRIEPGHPDEIWLKLLGMRHGREKHTPAGWRALIDGYRGQPAHPSVMGV